MLNASSELLIRPAASDGSSAQAMLVTRNAPVLITSRSGRNA